MTMKSMAAALIVGLSSGTWLPLQEEFVFPDDAADRQLRTQEEINSENWNVPEASIEKIRNLQKRSRDWYYKKVKTSSDPEKLEQANLISIEKLTRLVEDEHAEDNNPKKGSRFHQGTLLQSTIDEIYKSKQLGNIDSTPTKAEVIDIIHQYRASVKVWREKMQDHHQLQAELPKDKQKTNEKYLAYLEESGARAVFIAADNVKKATLIKRELYSIFDILCNIEPVSKDGNWRVPDKELACKAVDDMSKRRKYTDVTRKAHRASNANWGNLTRNQRMYQLTLIQENERRDKMSTRLIRARKAREAQKNRNAARFRRRFFQNKQKISTEDQLVVFQPGTKIEPAVEEPAVDEPAVEEPAVEEQAVEEPAVDEPAVVEPAVVEPAVVEPVAVEPLVTDAETADAETADAGITELEDDW